MAKNFKIRCKWKPQQKVWGYTEETERERKGKGGSKGKS